MKNKKIMVWPPSSPDLNPTENFWSLLKRNIYADRRQYTSKNQLWNAIISSASDIMDSDHDIQNLNNSVDDRIIEVI